MVSFDLDYRDTADGRVVVAGKGMCADEEIVIPSDVSGKVVVGIDEGAFRNETGVRSVSLPEGVEYIGEEAFYGCTDLEIIYLPASLREIGERAFGCRSSQGRVLSLKEVHVADLAAWCGVRFSQMRANPLLGGASLFVDGERVTDLVIPDGVSCVSRRAFVGCGSIETLILSDGVERIMGDAFAKCKNLWRVTLGAGLKKIDRCAFLESENILAVMNLSGLVIEPGSRENGRVAVNAEVVADNESLIPVNFMIEEDFEFRVENERITLVKYHGKGGKVTLPQMEFYAQYDVGKNAFLGCDEVTDVVIPPWVKRIGERAFFDCRSLHTVWMGFDVTEIGGEAFAACKNLYKVSLDESLVKIGERAFEGCVNLVEVENRSGLDIETGSDAHGGVARYAENVYGSWQGESRITRREGYEFFGDVSDARLLGCPGNDGSEFNLPNFEFPYTLSPYIFSDTLYVRDLTVPWCVVRIGDCAFLRCCDLRSLIMEEGVREIGASAFELCFSIESVVLPKSVKKVGARAFTECECLELLFYGGSEDDFDKLEVETGNDCLTKANIFYYSEEEPNVIGLYWHFGENGRPEVW